MNKMTGIETLIKMRETHKRDQKVRQDVLNFVESVSVNTDLKKLNDFPVSSYVEKMPVTKQRELFGFAVFGKKSFRKNEYGKFDVLIKTSFDGVCQDIQEITIERLIELINNKQQICKVMW